MKHSSFGQKKKDEALKLINHYYRSAQKKNQPLLGKEDHHPFVAGE
jgi:hypothetical protein